jgi:hypothetical protein
MNKCSLYCWNVYRTLSVFSEIPLMRKINETAPYFTEYSVRRGPETARFWLVRDLEVRFLTLFGAQLGIECGQKYAPQNTHQEPVFT